MNAQKLSLLYILYYAIKKALFLSNKLGSWLFKNSSIDVHYVAVILLFKFDLYLTFFKQMQFDTILLSVYWLLWYTSLHLKVYDL